MRAIIIFVLLALMMSMTIEVDGLISSSEQTNEDSKYCSIPVQETAWRQASALQPIYDS